MVQLANNDNQKVIDELRAREAEELAQVLASKYGLTYVDLSKLSINTDALRLISEGEARAGQIASFKITGKKLDVATISPNNPKTEAVIKELTDQGLTVTSYLVSPASLERAWERYPEIGLSTRTEAGVIDISSREIDRYLKTIAEVTDVQKLLTAEAEAALKSGGISNLLEIILAGSLSTRASDIHVEPQEERVRLRYRLDGVLHDISFVEHKVYRQMLSRVKLVSGLKLNIQNNAQDGRFTIRAGEAEIEIRTSIIPGAYGESIVLRVLNPETIAVGFDQLGMEERFFGAVDREIKKPNGMIIITGPTGSGKTTSLYSFLRQVSNKENKIITIEDPIEYHLAGINQTQVDRKKDYTFLSGLRAALRQDPDIIMVGEIRDAETAKTAVDAALTGHLVFSTLHTNNAAGTFPRLIGLGVDPKIIEAAVNLAMAQRLVRKLCVHCKQATIPTAEEKTLLDKLIASIKRKRPELILPASDKWWQPAASGCAECHQTGYRGRIGIFEGILIDQAITEVLVKNPNEREIKLAALPQGLLDMREDGVIKVLNGITDWAELGRVVDLPEEIL